MDRLIILSLSLPYLILPSFFISGVSSTTFKFVNNCPHTVWPGILSNPGTPIFSTTGFALSASKSRSVTAPSSWAGRFWARTGCSNDSAGKFSCLTADCGSGEIGCSGAGARPPATLSEITLSGSGGLDYYDVSLVDGFNLPMSMAPQGGSGQNCTTTGCAADLNSACPSALRVVGEDGKESVACKSACYAFGDPQYCCSEAYASPDTCKPSSYSEAFKNACPRAYSYAYDDKTSTFTCGSSPDYVITFCPSPSPSPSTSRKTSTQTQQNLITPVPHPIFNSGMVYEGALVVSSAISTTMCGHVLLWKLLAGGFAWCGCLSNSLTGLVM